MDRRDTFIEIEIEKSINKSNMRAICIFSIEERYISSRKDIGNKFSNTFN